MRIFRDITNLPDFKNAVVTIGSFDGVHIGHQKIISRVNQLAREVDGESVLVTFHPHPRKIIFPKDNTLRLLNTLDEKLELCKKYGIDNVVVVPFSIEFSKQSPREYVENFLMKSFHPKYIVIGYDHKFGLNRDGNIDLLKQYTTDNQFSVIEIQKQEIEDIAISSSKIRRALDDGNITEAQMFLGSPYKISGEVVHGDKIGTSIGFPTANITLENSSKLLPKDGVYAVNCNLDGLIKQGMMYIGRRPTLSENQSHKSIEVNIFDFNDDIYGEHICIEIADYIRGDEKFDSLAALQAQLHKDKRDTEAILGKLVPAPPYKKDKVCIAILNYNGEEYLESFLPQVLYSASSPINIAVIDNASTDDSVAYLKEWHPEIQLVELTKNYGFAEGYNQGLKQISAEYIVLLNSDVLVTDHWLDPILKLMDSDKNIAACQPKILSLERKTHFEHAGAAGGYVDTLGYPYCRGRILDFVEEDKGQYDDIVNIDWASGAALVIRNSMYHNFLGLDKDYFAHMEEIDLCWRIRRAGYAIKVVPQSVVYHLGGGTLSYVSPRKVYLNFRNNLVTILKNDSFGKLLWLIPLRLGLDGLAGLKFLSEGDYKATLAIIKAHFAVYGSLGHILRKRALYNRTILKHSISNQSNTGSSQRINQSPIKALLVNYFIKGKRKFSDF